MFKARISHEGCLVLGWDNSTQQTLTSDETRTIFQALEVETLFSVETTFQLLGGTKYLKERLKTIKSSIKVLQKLESEKKKLSKLQAKQGGH